MLSHRPANPHIPLSRDAVLNFADFTSLASLHFFSFLLVVLCSCVYLIASIYYCRNCFLRSFSQLGIISAFPFSRIYPGFPASGPKGLS